MPLLYNGAWVLCLVRGMQLRFKVIQEGVSLALDLFSSQASNDLRPTK